MSLEDVEGFLIKKALARYGGNVSQAAKALGLSRSALVPAAAAIRTVTSAAGSSPAVPPTTTCPCPAHRRVTP